MIKIIGGRGTGKTTELIKTSADTQIPILCLREGRRRYLIQKASVQGVKIPAPILFEDYQEDSLVRKVLIDDTESILSKLLIRQGYDLQGYTISTGDLQEELKDLNKWRY